MILVGHDLKANTLNVDAIKATNSTPLLMTVKAPIGDGFDGDAVEQQLRQLQGEKRGAVLWVRPPNNLLDAKLVNLAGLAHHPSVADLAARIRKVGMPVYGDILGEITDPIMKGGKVVGLRYGSIAVAHQLYSDIWDVLRETQLFHPCASFEPHTLSVASVAKSIPPVAIEEGHALDVHFYGESSVTGKCDDVASELETFAQTHGMELWSLEQAYADGPQDGVQAVQCFVKPLLARILAKKYRIVQLCANKVATGYPMWKPFIRWAPGIGLPLGQPAWPGVPEIATALRQAYALPDVITLEGYQSAMAKGVA